MNYGQRRGLVIIIALLIIAGAIWTGRLLLSDNGESAVVQYEKAEVLEIKDNFVQSSGSVAAFSQETVKLKILSGRHEGNIVECINSSTDNPLTDVKIQVGSLVLVSIREDGGNIASVNISGPYRVSLMAFLLLIVVFLVLLIGGLQGLKSLIIVGISVICLFKFMLPAIVGGSDPLAMLVIAVTALSCIIIAINNGINVSSAIALAGTLSGCLFAALAAYVFLNNGSISGFASIESRIGYYMENFKFNMSLLLFCGMVLSSLGAVTDLCLAVSAEMRSQAQSLVPPGMMTMFMNGIKAGRGRLQSTITILCLAFCGMLVPFLAFHLAYSDSVRYILNSELVAGEILRLGACYLCLCLALPLTAFYGLAVQLWPNLGLPNLLTAGRNLWTTEHVQDSEEEFEREDS